MNIWAEREVAQARFDICKQCDRFVSITNQCMECGCFMKLKVKMLNMECPLHKWSSSDNSN